MPAKSIVLIVAHHTIARIAWGDEMNTEMRRPLILMILPIVIVGCSFKNCLTQVGCDGVDVPNLNCPAYLSIEQACVNDECAPVDTAVSPLQIDNYLEMPEENEQKMTFGRPQLR